jgi:hypothetical protein
MGIIHICDRQKNVIFVVWDGAVTGGVWLAHARSLLAEPEWPAIFRIIGDLRTVSDTRSIRDEEIEKAAALFTADPAIVAGKRVAIVATEEFRKAKRFMELIARFRTTTVVFNTLDTACMFLGINLAETRQTLEELRTELRARG